MTCPILWIGNRQEKTSYIIWWQSLAMSTLVYSAGTAAYFLAVQFQSGFLANIDTWIKDLSSANPAVTTGDQAARFVVFVSFLDAAVIFYIPTLIFVICVHLRCVQIRKAKDRLTTPTIQPWDSFELSPYRIPRPKLTAISSGDDTKRKSAPAGLFVNHGDGTHSFQNLSGQVNIDPDASILNQQNFESTHNRAFLSYDNTAFSQSSEAIEPYTSATITPMTYANASSTSNQNSSLNHGTSYYDQQGAIYSRPSPRTRSVYI